MSTSLCFKKKYSREWEYEELAKMWKRNTFTVVLISEVFIDINLPLSFDPEILLQGVLTKP